MRENTLVIHIDDDVADFLGKQGQLNPTAYINHLLRQDMQQEPEQVNMQEILDNEPNAGRTGAKPGSAPHVISESW